MVVVNGIQFEDDEITIVNVDGKPEYAVYESGVRKIIRLAPNRVRARDFEHWFNGVMDGLTHKGGRTNEH